MDRFVTRGELPLPRAAIYGQKKNVARNIFAHEVTGRLTAEGLHSFCNQFLDSCVELGSIPQSNISRCFPPPPGAASWLSVDEDSLITFGEIMHRGPGRNYYSQRPYISGIEFDKKGVYVASVSCGGCLSIHDFDKLRARASASMLAEVKPDVYIPTRQRLEAIKWNPENQDELACVAAGTSSVIIYDLERNASMPSEILTVKRGAAASAGNRGLYDLAYACSDRYRMVACGRDGCVYTWDRRTSQANVSSMTASSPLNSLQLSADEQVVCAGSEGGGIHTWDIRGGRGHQTFGSTGEVHHAAVSFVSVASLLRNIKSLQAQTDIGLSPVLSIALDPANQRRIAFYLNNGWSGAVDLTTQVLTHAHCPPPPWLATSGNWSAWSHVRRRKPAWLTTHSVFCVGPAAEPALHFLDFSANSWFQVEDSRRHVRGSGRGRLDSSKRSVKLSECAVAIAVHPLSSEIVVGSKEGSLLVVGQSQRSTSGENSSEESPSTSESPNQREGGQTAMEGARSRAERINRFFRLQEEHTDVAVDGGGTPAGKRLRMADRDADGGGGR